MLAAILLVGMSLGSGKFDDALRRLNIPAQQSAAADDLVALGPSFAIDIVRRARTAAEPAGQAMQDVLVRMGAPALDTLWKCQIPMFTGEFSECDFAVHAVVRMGDDVLPILERFVGEGRMDKSGFVFQTLRTMGPDRALPSVERLAKDGKIEVVRSAYGIMSSWNGPLVADALVKGLDSKDGPVQLAALRGLTRMRDRRLIPCALVQSADDRGGLQEAAVGALGALYEVAFRKPILRVARRSPFVAARWSASKVLRAVDDPIANNLGVRYAVISIDPPAQAGIQRRHQIQVLGTVLLALLILRLARVKSYGWPLSAAALLAGGYFWGNVITKINGDVERSLLLLVIPAVWLMARFMGTNMVGAMGLLLPFVLAFAGDLLATGLIWFLLYVGPAGLGLVVLAYGGYLPYFGFVVGAALGVWLLNRRRREVAFAADAALTRLATTGCAAFYAGYCLGWWRLWQYSPEAFSSLL